MSYKYEEQRSFVAEIRLGRVKRNRVDNTKIDLLEINCEG
jgi:hypothetical protein